MPAWTSRSITDGAVRTVLVAGPLAGLVATGFVEGLGANPVEAVTRYLGRWALRLLLVTLALAPLARFAGTGRPLAWRRAAGLAAFGYACLHVATYAVFDLGLSPAAFFDDVAKRAYITLGAGAFLLLAGLAATSVRAVARRLSPGTWAAVHRAVFPAAVLAVLHHAFMLKTSLTPALFHGGILALLLALRAVPYRWSSRRT